MPLNRDEEEKKKAPPLGGSCDVSDDVTTTKLTGKLEQSVPMILLKFETCAPRGTVARAVVANRDIS